MSNVTSISHNEVKLPIQFYRIFFIFLIKAKYPLSFKLKNEGLISLKSDYFRFCVRWLEAKLLWKEQIN